MANKSILMQPAPAPTADPSNTNGDGGPYPLHAYRSVKGSDDGNRPEKMG